MITTPITAAFVRGCADLEPTGRGLRPHRLPEWVRTQFPEPQLLMAQSRPSGVRLRIVTAARTVELIAHSTRIAYRGAPRARGAIDLVVDGAFVVSRELDGGDLIEIDLQTGGTERHPGGADTITFRDLPEGDKVVELWLPHNESVELITLRTDEPVRPVEPSGRVWVHHGSSISQGSNASTPTRIWPVVAARQAGVDLRNLGFSGSAMVDPFAARVLRDAPADLISVKLGINVVNGDVMRLRSFVPAVHGFLDTIRDGHPDTPLLVISPVFCGIHEDTPGPGAIDMESLATGRVTFKATGGDLAHGRLTLRVIRDALAEVADRRGDDPNLHYLDGTSLYGAPDAAGLPLPDALHPDTATHQLIGDRFAQYAFGPNGPFAAP
jgi:GDSL-like lipase/acylhydrolase family protein